MVLTLQQQLQVGCYQRALQVDSVKAATISRIQDEYKAGMQTLEGQVNIPEDTHRDDSG